MIIVCCYLTGWAVATGYEIGHDEPRLYDMIVCPLLWPAVMVLQIGIFMLKRDQKRLVQ